MSTKTTAACAPEPVLEEPIQEKPIRDRLRRRLLALNYRAFAHCLCLLLHRLGYEDVHVAGRTRWKGRNREGGYDIEASLPAGVGRRRIIVQVKQFDALPVFQRAVDELRGTCLRAGAAEALLITTSTFSPVVLRNAELQAGTAGAQVAPVRLLDGNELLDLLVLHRVGVWEEAGASASHPCRLGLDDAFFDELSRTYAGDTFTGDTLTDNGFTGNRRRAVPHPAHEGQRPSWLLTIRVSSPGSTGAGPRTGKGTR